MCEKCNFSASISSVRPSQHCLSPRWLGSVVYLPEAPMLPAMSHLELRNQQFIGFNRPSLTAGVPYWKQTLALRTAHHEFSDWSIREHALRGVYAIIKSLRTWYTRMWLFDNISCIIMFFKQRVRIEWANFRSDARCVYLRRRRRATPHFFRHHAISYGWHNNSSVGDSNYCYVIRRTY